MTQRHSPAAKGAPALLPLLDITNVYGASSSDSAEARTPGSCRDSATPSYAGSTCSEAASDGRSPRDSVIVEPQSPRQRAKACMADLGVECSWSDSDSFYMYVYKVMICPKKYSHEWSACPFAHKGERATRRDPRHLHYGASSCPDFKSGSCSLGDLCPNSHGVFEACLHPERYRTQLCNSGANCKRSVCFFAHALSELRTPTCQPSPVQLSPAQSPSSPPQPQAQLVQQLLGLAPDAAPKAAKPTAEINPSGPVSDEQALLRAQLANCQLALEQLTSMLSGAHLSGQNQCGAADIVAQLQRQSASLLPQQTMSFPYGIADPVVQRTSAATSHGCFQAPDKLTTELGSVQDVMKLSPRTPFEHPTDVLSPSSGHGLFLGQNPVSLASAYRQSHATELRPEDRLPSTLMDSIW
mmetsp:Transcript_35027/g.99286  ORF Transcript_35027/g.99286 Transcript_35027/m.99286 type:complete len:412 (+) Transcript_35027:293-1528(+)